MGSFDVDSLKTLIEDPRNFFLKNIVLYGANNTGKSTMTLHIIHSLKSLIPMVYAFAGTPGAYTAIKGIIPERCIEREFTLKRAKEIYDRQVDARATYDIANDPAILQSLFHRIAGKQKVEVEKTVIAESKQAIEMINACDSLDKNAKRSQVKEVESSTKEFLVGLYKHTIGENQAILDEMDLVATERTALKFRNFNPNVLVIVDDCGAMISEKMQKTEEFKNYFMMYRHVGITPIFTFQDDTELIAKLKKQASISIFTSQQCASAFFTREAMKFPKQMQIDACRAIDAIFDPSHRLYPKFTKFMWIRDDEHPYRHYKAEEHDPFEFGSRALWEFCKRADMKKSASRAITSTFGVYDKVRK
jgi:hypothetical protein